MKNKVHYLFILLVTFIFFGCKDEENGTKMEVPYDPSKPVEVSTFMPDSGGLTTKFVVKGKNFGTDISKIKVIFNENKEATIIASNGETIYCLVPKQPAGDNKVSVVVENNRIDLDKTFHYTAVELVSTITGQTGVGGYVDGPLLTARFNRIPGVGVLTGNNILLCEGYDNRVRLASIDDNVVTTLYSGNNFVKPAVTKDRKKAYVISKIAPHVVFCFSQDALWAPKTIARKIEGVTGEIWAAALDDDEKYLYFRDHYGKFGRIEIANPLNVEILNQNCGAVDLTVSYLAFNSVDQHFYLSVQNSQGIYRISKDGKTVEQYVGFNGIGNVNGPRQEAVLRNPTGMTFDSEGNLYFCDSMGFVIRKVDFATGYCSTIAGTYNKGGGDDGEPLKATLNYPYDIAVDDEDNFYISQTWGCSLRKLAIE
jgi:hypothetical protein